MVQVPHAVTPAAEIADTDTLFVALPVALPAVELAVTVYVPAASVPTATVVV